MTLTPEHWIWNRAKLDSEPQLDFAADCPTVWLARLTDDSRILAHLLSLLSEDERLRLERFQVREDQHRFLIGRGLLRRFVGRYLNVPAKSVEFHHGPFGKPSVLARAGQPALPFNVSHSGQLVLLAFHERQAVGVDVEEMRQELDWREIARGMFPPPTYQHLLDSNPENGLMAFYQAWTRHEAGLKAVGRGLGERAEANPDSRLSAFDLQLPAGYQGAVALAQ